MPHETSSAAMRLEALRARWTGPARRPSPCRRRRGPATGAAGSAPRRRVTLAQIAEETGLSMATVSKVLNGKPDVSVRTHALVRQALLHFPATASGRTMTAPPLIDMVFNDFDSPWAIEIVRGAAAAAQAEGLTVAFTALSEGDEQLVQRPTTESRRGQVGGPAALAPHLSHGDVCGIASE